jgi:ABC-type Fe3+/spermidine/putrescine transport system ATPase subunit
VTVSEKTDTGAGDSAGPQGAGVTGSDRETPAVEVRGLTKVYNGEILAVDEIDFTIQPGDFCVIIGPSGCGKSTTLHSIVGKVEPTGGRVLIDGQDVTDRPIHERDIGLVFQDFQLFPHLTVEENVRYGLERLGRGDDGIVEETLSLMNLTGSQDSSTVDLSAGQRQRVALARSLVLRPEVLLLDEPLGDMDYKLQKRMERELLRVHREVETTFVYVTHDQRQAMRMGDHLIVMNEGLIEQAGPTEEIYQQPATAFVAAFVGDSNILTGSLDREGETGDGTGEKSGTSVVETPYGTFRVSGDPPAAPPDEVSFVVRPHALRVNANGSSEDGSHAHGGDDTAMNRLTGTVLDVIDQPSSGTQVFVEVRAESEAAQEIQAKSWDPLAGIQTGETVTVSWAAADAHLLTETSVAADVDLSTDILGE